MTLTQYRSLMKLQQIIENFCDFPPTVHTFMKYQFLVIFSLKINILHQFFLQCDQYTMPIDNQKSICFKSMIHFLTHLAGICLALRALRHN